MMLKLLIEKLAKKYFFKLFDFEHKANLKLAEIKDLLGFNLLQLNSGNRPNILHCCNNINRVALEIDKKLITKIRENPNKALTITKVNTNWPHGEYTTFRITSY